MTAEKISGHHRQIQPQTTTSTTTTSSTGSADGAAPDSQQQLLPGTPQRIKKAATAKNSGSVRKPYVKRACTNCKKAHSGMWL